jgi:hypothetical protein
MLYCSEIAESVKVYRYLVVLNFLIRKLSNGYYIYNNNSFTCYNLFWFYYLVR